MSAHEKENGKRSCTGLGRVGLSCDADGQAEQRGRQPDQESNSSTPTQVIQTKQSPSKLCYRLVGCVRADFLQLAEVLLRQLLSLALSERSH